MQQRSGWLRCSGLKVDENAQREGCRIDYSQKLGIMRPMAGVGDLRMTEPGLKVSNE